MSPKIKKPQPAGDALGQLLKLDPATSLTGYSDGLQAAYAYTPDEWREHALRLATSLASTGQPFTVSDLRRLGLPEPEKPQQWGSLIAAIKHQRIAKQVGWAPSLTARGEERGVRVWQGLTPKKPKKRGRR
ncbi:hypothetical protein GCM10027417_23990 [Glutamicibacter endophyticus]